MVCKVFMPNENDRFASGRRKSSRRDAQRRDNECFISFLAIKIDNVQTGGVLGYSKDKTPTEIAATSWLRSVEASKDLLG